MISSVFAADGIFPIFIPLGNEGGIDGVEMFRTRRLTDDCLVPMVQVCTLSNDAVIARMAAGEDSGELLEDYTSSFWFNDRASFVAVYRVARMISKGGRIEGDSSIRMIHEITRISDVPVDVVADVSIHHMAGTK
jgi:hypothetical protein